MRPLPAITDHKMLKVCAFVLLPLTTAIGQSQAPVQPPVTPALGQRSEIVTPARLVIPVPVQSSDSNLEKARPTLDPLVFSGVSLQEFKAIQQALHDDSLENKEVAAINSEISRLLKTRDALLYAYTEKKHPELASALKIFLATRADPMRAEHKKATPVK